jgi:DNA-binding response OmpR family regulator
MSGRRTPIQGPARVLVAVSDGNVAQAAALALDHGAYESQLTTTLAATREALTVWLPPMLILDVEMEQDRAMELIGQHAEDGARLPVIAVTRRGDLRLKLTAFDRGADDIISLPLVPEEFVARVHAVMRRAYGDAIAFIPVIRIHDLEIDLIANRVRVGTSDPHLTPTEQALLYLLAANPGQTMSRETILDAIWGSDYVAESNLVDRHVRSLRVKLQNSWREPRYIATVAGKGYRFLP